MVHHNVAVPLLAQDALSRLSPPIAPQCLYQLVLHHAHTTLIKTSELTGLGFITRKRSIGGNVYSRGDRGIPNHRDG